MPEYLAPGVYVEEIDTGSKPIEGVSTSTCGVVGVTERGPVDVPVLVTSVGEYVRWFGGLLRADDYDTHRFLPHAIEGFFANGGKRVYVVRVVDASATRAESSLYYPGKAAPTTSVLVRTAGEATGSGANPPPLIVLPGTGLATDDWVRMGDGSGAEYRQVAAAPVAETVMVATALPLSRSHTPVTSPVVEYARVVDLAFTLVSDVAPGATQIVVQGASADIDAVVVAAGSVEVGADPVTAEYRMVVEATSVTVVSATDKSVTLRLDSGLRFGYDATTPVSHLDLSTPLDTANVALATAGSGLFFVDLRAGMTDRTHLVSIGSGATQEVRRIGELDELPIAPSAVGYDAGTLVETMGFAADRTLSAVPTGARTTLVLQPGETRDLVVGQRIVVASGGPPDTVSVVQLDPDQQTLTVTPAVSNTHAVADAVTPAPKQTQSAVPAGGRVLPLDDRMGLVDGSTLHVGVGAAAQIVTVHALPALSGVAPDPGNVVVSPPLTTDVANHTPVQLLGAPSPVAGCQVSVLALPAAAGADTFYVSDGKALVSGDVVRLTQPDGEHAFHTLSGPAAGATPVALTLKTALARAHPSGSMLVERTGLIDVQALDAGIWGNRLCISAEDEKAGLVNGTTLATVIDAHTIRLASASGVQPGTVLEFTDGNGALLGDPVKVSSINRSAQNTITLAAPGLSAPEVPGSKVRSREFRITVGLLRQPDPSVPSRDSQVIDVEVFDHLSLDPRHSNYVEKVIGAMDGAHRKWDHRPEGSSLYVRVRDLGADEATKESVRLGPETLFDLLPDGRQVPAQLRLETILGGDSIGAIGDSTYLGSDNVDPELRTGLQSLANIEEVSLVAVPGQVSARLQQGIIDHCELMRYRFAVLDTTPEPADTISDAQGQRQQFDTKYAALYYPWLSIPEPFPTNLADIHDYRIPPSGHMLGVYARTDIDRGVHKAPANEVVRGITGLRRSLSKSEQDILNPYPVNVNVIRDFRDNNRGIRVYGGRVMTSDPDWKYVNVRRLMIFIEASLDRGLQWVVFEPNADALWARVRRVISNFLTTVWRSGALEGTKVEEAFFVKCDRTTMTQTDIDNGRLIVVVGVAPVKPAEFVIVRIGLWTAHADT